MKIKNFLLIFLVILTFVAICLINASASNDSSGALGEDLTWHFDIETRTLTIDGTGTALNTGNDSWDSDGSQTPWAAYYSQIEKIVIGESITTIGNFAFFNMKDSLTTVELTENVKTIGACAFADCRKLSTIYIKGNEPIVGTIDLTYITDLGGGYQFDSAGRGCILNIIMGDDLAKVGDKTFAYVYPIESITFPKNLTYLAERALVRNTGLKTITFMNPDLAIPESFLMTSDENVGTDAETPLTDVYGYEDSTAEAWVERANSYYAENGISRRITFHAMERLYGEGKAGENLSWKIKKENGEYVMYILGTGSTVQAYNVEKGAFENEQSYDKIAFGKHDWADLCGTVNKIIIEAPVTQIFGYSFSQFDECHTVVLPISMTQIKNCGCFADMEALETFYTVGQSSSEGTANLSNISDIGEYSFEKALFNKIVLAKNVTVGDFAFALNSRLEGVEIPNGAEISDAAFRGCCIGSVDYDSKISSVLYKTFLSCDGSVNKNLTSIRVNNPVASFEDCTSTDYSVFLTSLPALSVVYGYRGSTAEEFVNWANSYYSDNGVPKVIKFIAIEYSYISGDTTGDSDIDVRDAVLLAQYLAAWFVEIDKNAADCNGDGTVDIRDAVLLAQYLARWNVDLEYPSGEDISKKDNEIDFDNISG